MALTVPMAAPILSSPGRPWASWANRMMAEMTPGPEVSGMAMGTTAMGITSERLNVWGESPSLLLRSMDNVRRLFKGLEKDPELRTRLYKADGQAGRDVVLREAGLYFSDAEFDEMVDVLHVQCQTREEAERFFEFRNWWDFLRRT